MTDKAFSVTQFVDIVNLSFEQFESVAVEGEISTSTKASSGHWYFSIKDEEAVLSCAMFRGNFTPCAVSSRLATKFESQENRIFIPEAGN